MKGGKVVVIGAGMGGLAAAMELAARGLEVTVCERAASPGGKMRQIDVCGRPIDAGPTVLTMRWVFEELLERCGLGWPQQLELTPMSVLARHAWPGGGQLDLFADPARTAEAIAALSGAAEAGRYLAFTRRTRQLYASLEHPFLRAARPSPLTIARKAGAAGLTQLGRLAPYATLWRALGRHFKDPRLRQLFARYATYVGSSPFLAPATLMLVAHVEQDGVWQVKGGMHSLAQSLARCAQDLGARLRYTEGVQEILLGAGRVAGVLLTSGERLPARCVVCNADVSALGSGRFGEAVRGALPETPRHRRSLSALTWALVAATEGFPLAHHNVFFSDDYRAEFDDVFRLARLPARPTVYVCAQDRGGGAVETAPQGAGERLLCLVNAPPGGDGPGLTRLDVSACEQRSFELLARCGLTVHRRPDAVQTTTPEDFEALFPATGGALYGAASHGWQAPFSRPGARTRVPGLYLAGGSSHPGAGVPMAALSGHQAASCVLADLGAR